MLISGTISTSKTAGRVRVVLIILTSCLLEDSSAFGVFLMPHSPPDISISRSLNDLPSSITYMKQQKATRFMTETDEEEDLAPADAESVGGMKQDKAKSDFFDAILEIPDPQLLAGDLLFILIINFLIQIADEIGDPIFWSSGGFGQPVTVTMPSTLLGVIVRDSKMSISWVIGALWNRCYSSSSVSDGAVAVKNALRIWVSFCSSRIMLELGFSGIVTHSTIDGWLLVREFWYTAVLMAFFRFVYSSFWFNRF